LLIVLEDCAKLIQKENLAEAGFVCGPKVLAIQAEA